MSTTDNTALSALDDILDQSIDDLKDLPEFKIPDTGMYRLGIALSMKEINKKASIIANITVRELLELEDPSIPEADRAKPGDKFDIAFILKNDDGTRNEIAEGRFKAFMDTFHKHFDDKSIRNVVTQHMVNPVGCTAKVVKKARKNDAEKFDAQLFDITVE